MRSYFGAYPKRRMLQRAFSALTAAAILSLFPVSLTGFAAPSQASAVNRYNIVLVTDASGSMVNTDPEEQRFEAIGKFIAQSTERGNYAGSVVFNSTVHAEGASPLTEMTDIARKKALVDCIRSVPPGGYTNIGLGLKTAVDMLSPGDLNGLPSIVLLLSDGNSEMPDEAQLKLSKSQRDEAVETARQQNIKVYTICLNANGKADGAELRDIAESTGGQFMEVKQARDLESVFEVYRQMIFNSVSAGSKTREFDASGTIQDTFSVASIGVEEVNLSMPGITNSNSSVLNYKIADPTGKEYNREELQAKTYEGKRFLTIKFIDPPPGDWSYTITGKPGDRITVDYVYNTNLSAHLSLSPEKDSYVAGDTLLLTAQLLADGAAPADEDTEGYRALGSVKIGRNDPVDLSFTAGKNGAFTCSFVIEKSGSFTFAANIQDKDGIATDAGSLTVNAGNSPPRANADIEETVYLWPFAANNNAAVDLRPGASDEQQAPLEYEVISSSFAADEYAIPEGSAALELYSKPNALKIGSYSRSKGSFEIAAYDAEGASCVFHVRVNTVDITKSGFIGLLAAVLLAAGAIAFSLWWLSQKRFNGKCFVQLTDANGFHPEREMEKPRGSLKLSAFKVYLPGLDAGSCWFQASGKQDHAYFCSKKPIMMNGKLSKKIRLDGDYAEHVQIAPASGDMEGAAAYLEVWFNSAFNSQGGGFGGGFGGGGSSW